MAIFRRVPPPNGGVKCKWGRQKSRFWAYIWLHCLLLTLQQARCCQHCRQWTTATVLQVNCDTSLVVSGGVDCGRRRRNVYNKKPHCYAKDNRTAHLTARSDKSVAYVTNNKRLYYGTRRFVLSKLIYKGSRGLFAIAELLVLVSNNSLSFHTWCTVVWSLHRTSSFLCKTCWR